MSLSFAKHSIRSATLFLALVTLMSSVATSADAQELRKTLNDFRRGPFQYQPSDPFVRSKAFQVQTKHYGLFYNCDNEECKRNSPYICWKNQLHKNLPTPMTAMHACVTNRSGSPTSLRRSRMCATGCSCQQCAQQPAPTAQGCQCATCQQEAVMLGKVNRPKLDAAASRIVRTSQPNRTPRAVEAKTETERMANQGSLLERYRKLKR